MIAAGIGVATLVLILTAGAAVGQEGKMKEGKSIDEVLRTHTRQLMSLPGVVGTARGLCSGSPCIVVYVIQKSSGQKLNIPEKLDGFQVVVKESGKFRPLPEKK